MKAVIFDIDGTLANVDHRRHFVEGKKKNFDAFYDAMDADTVREEIRELCNMYSDYEYQVIICTGRPELYAGVTERWLIKNGICFNVLMCRPDDSRNEKDYIIKQDMLNEILKTHEVILAVDDRQQVVDMWRRNGITCLQCADGNF